MNQVELWEQELKAAGWRPMEAHPHAAIWRAPSGELIPGPGYAWQVMTNSNATTK